MGGTDDKLEGKWDNAKGKVKEGVGDATDNEQLENEGKGDQVKGKAKEAWGNVQDAGEKAKDAVKDAFD